MDYKHILVAVDLSKSSEIVISRAVSLAEKSTAKLSFIYADSNYVTNYMGLSNAGGVSNAALGSVVPKIVAVDEKSAIFKEELQALAEQADYPVSNTLAVMGDLNNEVKLAVKELDIDLLVCGHHHDFWRNLLSSVRQLISTPDTDLLLVQLDK
ncbi:universal stress protein [Psychromonas aquimarina]|uniref:universal stress protein n=1 Tax=Psychromonas aquimarina TaxID=444919 RepID=UPI000419D9DF|nr:universal stress protein [Psychromonas aquimarina]